MQADDDKQKSAIDNTTRIVKERATRFDRLLSRMRLISPKKRLTTIKTSSKIVAILIIIGFYPAAATTARRGGARFFWRR